MRNGKGKTGKTANHDAFSVLQRWQIYTNIAPFVLAVKRLPAGKRQVIRYKLTG
jgi:hypothetical protein